jgi:hypothetical protein
MPNKTTLNTHSSKRLKSLLRQKRVRKVEQRQALNELAFARSEQERLGGLTKRAFELAAQYQVSACPDGGPNSADELAVLAQFQTELLAVSSSAKKMEDSATKRSQAASSHLSQAQQKLDKTSDALDTEMRGQEALEVERLSQAQPSPRKKAHRSLTSEDLARDLQRSAKSKGAAALRDKKVKRS